MDGDANYERGSRVRFRWRDLCIVMHGSCVLVNVEYMLASVGCLIRFLTLLSTSCQIWKRCQVRSSVHRSPMSIGVDIFLPSAPSSFGVLFLPDHSSLLWPGAVRARLGVIQRVERSGNRAAPRSSAAAGSQNILVYAFAPNIRHDHLATYLLFVLEFHLYTGLWWEGIYLYIEAIREDCEDTHLVRRFFGGD